jgi:hypothetical protein
LFLPVRRLQSVCGFLCALELEKKKKAKKEKVWKENKKVIKENLKTHKDYLKELQIIFNKFIRLRDNGNPCISCERTDQKKYDAGHFYSVGSSPSVRFDEENCFSQCVYCNRHNHGNLLEYRERLIKKIGIERFDNLTDRRNETKKYSIQELKELITHYKIEVKKFI